MRSLVLNVFFSFLFSYFWNQHNSNAEKTEPKSEPNFDESNATDKAQNQQIQQQQQQQSTQNQSNNQSQTQDSTSQATANKSFVDSNSNEGNEITVLVTNANITNNEYRENGRTTERKTNVQLNITNRENNRNIVTEQIVWIASNPRGKFIPEIIKQNQKKKKLTKFNWFNSTFEMFINSKSAISISHCIAEWGKCRIWIDERYNSRVIVQFFSVVEALKF